MLHQDMLAAIHTWQAMLSEARHQNRILRKCAFRMIARVLSAAFATWLALWKVEKKHRQLMQRVILRMEHRDIASAFHTWRGNIQMSKRDLHRVRSLLGKLGHRNLWSHFLTWREHVAERRRNQHILTRVFASISKRTIMKAFRSWAEHVQEQIRLRFVLRKSLSKLVNRCLWHAFLQWSQCASTLRRNRRVIGNVVAKLRHRSMAAAVVTWHEAASHLGKDRQRLRHVLLRIVNKGLARSFEAWRCSYLTAVQRKQKQRAFLNRWRLKGVFQCFETWAAATQAKRRNRHRIRCTLGRFLNQRMSAAFASWKELLAATRHQRAVLLRVAARFRFRLISKAVSQWVAVVREASVLSQRSRALSAVVRFALGRVRKTLLSRVYQAWKCRCQELQARRRKVWLFRRVALRFQHTALSAAVTDWMEVLHSRNRLARHNRKRASRSQAATWRAWRKFVLQRKQGRHRAKLVVRRLLLQQSAAAIAKWRAVVRDHACASKLIQAAGKLQQSRKQLSEKSADLTTLFEERAALQVNLDQVAMLSAQTLREYEALALHHRETEAALLESSRHVESLSQARSELKDQNSLLEEQTVNLSEQIRVLTSAVVEAKSIIAELERESSYQVLDMESQLNSTVSEASMLRGDFASVSYELSQKRAEMQQMERRIEVRARSVLPAASIRAMPCHAGPWVTA